MRKLLPALLSGACVLALTALTLAACTGGGSGGDTDAPAVTTADITETVDIAETAETAAGEVTNGEPATDETTAVVTDGENAETEPATSKDTAEDTEPETLAPRYDYFAADVGSNVTIDASVYTAMQLTLPADLQVTDEDVRDYIDYLRFRERIADNGAEHMTDQPLKMGDDAFVYYRGVLDGEEFEGGSNWDNESPYQLGLGSGDFIPGFEEGLVGVIPANATRDNPAEIHVTFPKDYDPALAGKEVTFYVAVVYAVQYSLPAYDRAFVEDTLLYEGEKDFYASDKAFLAEFENYVREYLEKSVAEDVQYAKIDALWNYLTENAVCRNLPQLELDYYFNAYVDEIEYYYEYYSMYGGASFAETYPTMEDFAKVYVGVGADGDWKAELNVICERMVQRDMIAHAIAEREGVDTVTDEEYQAEIDYWVEYYGGYMTAEDIEANMGEAYIREAAFSAKMQEWLLARATFTYETADAD